MYTEEYEDRGKPIKKFLITFVVVLVLIVVLNIVTKNMTKDEIVNVEGVNTVPYKTAIYKDNIDHISDVMYGYFTQDKLKEIGNKNFTITIDDLIKDGQLVSVVDNYDKVCDSKKSNVLLTKYGDKEYILKIKLKCSKEDDYVIKHIGHYNYCGNYLCEKEENKVVNKPTKPTDTVKIADSKINNKIKTYPKEVTPYVPVGDKTKQFQYAKTTGAKFDNWSSWSGWTRTSCNTKAENCDDKNPLCRRKIVLFNQQEKISTYKHKYDVKRKEIVQSTTSELKGCNQYNYVVIDGVVYATSTVYTIVNSISDSTKSTQGSWEYKGEQSFDKAPSDTATIRYKYIKTDFSACGENCQGKTIKYVYDVYEYTGTLIDTNTDPKGLLCNGSYKKTIATYQTTDTVDSASRVEPVYGKVCYYNMKTRKIKKKGNTKTTFGVFNDTKLLDSGYYYTGTIK